MIETIYTNVVTDINDEAILEIEYEDDVLTLKLDNKEICRMDWENNMLPLINRMKEMWE